MGAMMAENIVSGLFGLTPRQVNQQQQTGINANALQFARLDPFERANMMGYQGGAGLGQIGAGMMGMVNPDVEEAKQREAALSQVDFQTPEGILNAAKAAGDRGDTKMSLQLQMLARQRIAEQQDAEVKSSEMAKNLAQAQKAMREEESAKTKYSSYAQQLIDEGITPRTPEFTSRMREYNIREEQGKGKGISVTNVMPGGKEFKDIPEFRYKVQQTIKPQLETVYASDQALSALNQSITQGNFIGFQAARVQLAKASGDSNISAKEIQAAGGDPSILGGLLDTTSTMFTGTPSLDTQNKIKATLKALKSVASKNAKGEIATQKKLGKMSGLNDDQINSALDFPQLADKKTRTLASGKVVTIED